MNWRAPEIQQLVKLALKEDRARVDVTTRALIHASWQVRAEIRAKQVGVVAGLPFARMIFEGFDSRCRFRTNCRDGAVVKKGTLLAVIEGSARSVLTAERPALNALQHLSGIATYTHEQVLRLASDRSHLYDTRKTLPGWRRLQKYAVRCGGGRNHRMSLADAILIKDNHLTICRLAESDWKKDFYRFRGRRSALPVQIEIQNDHDLEEAIMIRPQMVLLDNMSLPRLRRMIRILRKKLPRVSIEVSGGVRPDQLRGLARLGIERISMGRLTHSAPAFDCSLDIVHVDPR